MTLITLSILNDDFIALDCPKEEFEDYLGILNGKWVSLKHETNDRYIVPRSKEREAQKMVSFLNLTFARKYKSRAEEKKTDHINEYEAYYKTFDSKPSKFKKDIEEKKSESKISKDESESEVETSEDEDDKTSYDTSSSSERKHSRSSSSNYYSSSSYASSSSDNFPSPGTPRKKYTEEDLIKQIETMGKRLRRVEDDVQKILNAIYNGGRSRSKRKK